MQRGSRVWWLYYGVQAAVFGAAVGALLGVRWLVKEAWGTDMNDWPSLLFTLVFLPLKWRAESVATVVCRRAGLWQEVPRGSRVERSLERVEPSGTPVPNPAPLDLARHSRRSDWTFVCSFAILGVLCVAGAVVSWRERDWDGFTTGAVGALVFLGLATFGLWSLYDDEVEVNERGLRRKYRNRITPWASIEGGKISQCRGSDGVLGSQMLRLEDAHGRRLWSGRIDDMPPQVRAELFAWLRARASLREPDADA